MNNLGIYSPILVKYSLYIKIMHHITIYNESRY